MTPNSSNNKILCSIYLYNNIYKQPRPALLMVFEQELELVGLSRNEAKVYCSLLKLGSASISEIAAKADVHRVNIYDALKRLAEKGLVSSVMKAEKRYFEVASPEALQLIIKRREDELNRVKKAIPQLLIEYNLPKTRQEVHHYKGKRGLVTLYENTLRFLPRGGTLYSIGSTGIMRDVLKFYINNYNKKRVLKHIKLKTIYYQQARKKPAFLLQERRFIPPSIGFFPVTTYIYGDRVAIISFDELLGIEIISKNIADAYLRYFTWLWDISSP